MYYVPFFKVDLLWWHVKHEWSKELGRDGEATLPGLGPARFHFALSGTEYCRFLSVFADTTLAHPDQQSFLFLMTSHFETVAYPPSGVILLQDNTVVCSPWQGEVCLLQQPRVRFRPFYHSYYWNSLYVIYLTIVDFARVILIFNLIFLKIIYFTYMSALSSCTFLCQKRASDPIPL